MSQQDQDQLHDQDPSDATHQEEETEKKQAVNKSATEKKNPPKFKGAASESSMKEKIFKVVNGGK